MLRPVCSSYEEEIVFQFFLSIGQLSRCTWPEEGKSTFFKNICWLACEATCECGVGGRQFPSSNFLQCLKLHILQQGLNPKPNQLAQSNVMNLVTASHPENLITAVFFYSSLHRSLACDPLIADFIAQKLWYLINCTSSRAWFQWQ
jgi:hypothetical protein